MKAVGKYYMKVLNHAIDLSAKDFGKLGGDEVGHIVCDALTHLRDSILSRGFRPWRGYDGDPDTPIDDIGAPDVTAHELVAWLEQASMVTFCDESSGTLLQRKLVEHRICNTTVGGAIELHFDKDVYVIDAVQMLASTLDDRVIISAGVSPDVVLDLRFFKHEVWRTKPLKPSGCIKKD